MDQAPAVLFANERFYNAFAQGNFEEMEAIWALEVAVSCLHPGHPPLFGQQAVLESWQLILQEGGTEGIQCASPLVSLYGELATVICYESLQGGHLLATNIFLLQQNEWKMVHHQAGPTSGQPPRHSPKGIAN